MKHLNKITNLIILLLLSVSFYAQETTTAAGDEATGNGGTVSFSIGQVEYTSITSSNGSISKGVQQPYSIKVNSGIDETCINLEMSIYPNPTTNFLTLMVEDTCNLTYYLYDSQGKIIKSNIINSTSTNIEMEKLSKASYYLKVANENQALKTFTIIKN